MDSCETKAFPELMFGDAARAEFFDGKCFKSAVREVASFDQVTDDVIRDLKGDFPLITK